MEGLKILADIMLQAAQFWKQIQLHCKSLANDRLKSDVENMINKYDHSERLRFWTSKGFKTQAVRFCAGWVALDQLCRECMEAMKVIHKEQHQNIRENPTFEEARQRVRGLANTYQKELKDAQKQCDDRSSAMQLELTEMEQRT